MYEFSSILNKSNRKTASPIFEHNKKEVFFQPKLTINQPNDAYEQEADAMADKVMRMKDDENKQEVFFKPGISSIQKKCEHCEEEEKKAQRKESSGEVTATSSTENYLNSLSGGRALAKSERSFFESGMGYDFSNVRIHTDTGANESAKNLNALAYTHGSDIVFGSGQYNSETDAGKKLLAHELTHVIQQTGNVSPKIQRQPGDDQKEPKNPVAEELENDGLFQKLEKKIRDKIVDEINHAPETITKAILDQIIDNFAPQEYREGLKKAGEAIIKTVTGKKNVSTSICDAIPGYHEGGSRDFKGQCCTGSYDSAQTCCPKDRFAPNEVAGSCCPPGQLANAGGKCMKPEPVDPTTICVAPGKKDKLGKCCLPPLDVIDGVCMNRPEPEPEPEPSPFSLTFNIGVIDDYNIDESVINSRQQAHFNQVKGQIHQFMEACPASSIYITGFADKPGTEEHNQDLGQHRADYVKLLLQLDLMNINIAGLPPLIFTRSEGENNPADIEAGEKFSARNRRVEIEFHSMCPALTSPSLIKPLPGKIKSGSPFKLDMGNF